MLFIIPKDLSGGLWCEPLGTAQFRYGSPQVFLDMMVALNKKHSHSRPSAGKAPLFFKKPLFRGFFLICHSRDQRKLHK